MMRLAPACVGLFCLSACFPHDLDWTISFSDETLETRAVMIEARILRGGCGGTDAVLERIEEVGTDLTLPELDSGTYGFSVRVSDSECFWYGAGCVDATLPADAVAVELLPIVPERACDAARSQRCLDGACETPTPGTPLDCPPGHAGCGDVCVRLDRQESCGRCSEVCGTGIEGVRSTTYQRNANGTHECVFLCDAYEDAPFACTDHMNDVLNCGEDGRACEGQANTRAFCELGTCRYQCIAGFPDRDGNAANGCFP
jgi:hypothetical protein